MQALLDTIHRWWAKPFDSNGDVINWVLTLILIFTVAFAWSRVLAHIEPVGGN